MSESAEGEMNSQPAPGHCCHQEKLKKLKRIRLLKIVILVLVIIISVLICSVWVLYVETVEDPGLAGYQEFCCSPDNQTCLTLLCPTGKQTDQGDVSGGGGGVQYFYKKKPL